MMPPTSSSFLLNAAIGFLFIRKSTPFVIKSFFTSTSVNSKSMSIESMEAEGACLPPSRPAVFDRSSPGASHPCVSCGACCAFYRASFPFMEVKYRNIPEEFVEEIIFPYVAMKGTNLKAVSDMRCIALKGEIGQFGTLCSVYDNRASCCRDFWPSLEDGHTLNPRCDLARKAHNMSPLCEADWASYKSQEATSNEPAKRS